MTELTKAQVSPETSDSSGTDSPGAGRGRLSPPLIAAAALAGALLIGIGIAGIVVGSQSDSGQPVAAPSGASTGPVGLVPVDSPQAGSADCSALLTDLPAALTNTGGALARRQLANPAPIGAAAWGGTSTTDPVVLRCGIEKPAELTATSELLGVGGVEWLRVNGTDSTTWYAVDRPVYVALTLPGGLSTGPIQDISTAISKALPAS
jgi:hypothetical protein